MKKKEYYYYYFDERNDDFAENNINGKQTPENYKYLPKNIFYRILKPIVYYLVLPIVSLAVTFMGVRIKNAKVINNRKDRKKGFFIYSNHTGSVRDVFSAPKISFPRQCYAVANPDAISIPGIKLLVKFLGVLPVPSSVKTYGNFKAAIDEVYEKGCAVSIFPEAHIWPKYNEIRDFSDVSFYYPLELDAPCLVKTTVYIKKKNGKVKPCMICDGPFYPDKTLPRREAQAKLRNQVRDTMIMRTEQYGSCLDSRHHYIKVASPDEVRTEVK